MNARCVRQSLIRPYLCLLPEQMPVIVVGAGITLGGVVRGGMAAMRAPCSIGQEVLN